MTPPRIDPEGHPESSGSEKRWLSRFKITPRKRIGQNFLIHPKVADFLAGGMEVCKGSSVVEVGAGAGAMTRALLDRGARVWAVEVDPRLVELLRERFTKAVRDERLHILSTSILDLDLEQLPGRPEIPVVLAGNLPYMITTPIVLWTLERRRLLRHAVFLMQQEVAARITAEPGGRTYGSITVWCAYHALTRQLMAVSPGSFWPVPAVNSRLVHFSFPKAPPVHVRDPRLLERVLSTTFGHRRKMLRASIGEALGDRALAIRLIEHAEIDPARRPETLSLQEFAALANTLGDAL